MGRLLISQGLTPVVHSLDCVGCGVRNRAPGGVQFVANLWQHSIDFLVDGTGVCCARCKMCARQWLSSLWEAQWCLDQAPSRNGSTSADIQRCIHEFSGLACDVQTANLLQTYAPVLHALQGAETYESFHSWWELLDYIADEANYVDEDEDGGY